MHPMNDATTIAAARAARVAPTYDRGPRDNRRELVEMSSRLQGMSIAYGAAGDTQAKQAIDALGDAVFAALTTITKGR